MTTKELHDILDNEDRKLSPSELKAIIYQLKNDVLHEAYEYSARTNKMACYKYGYYMGEQNAFYLVLDLLEHLKRESSE